MTSSAAATTSLNATSCFFGQTSDSLPSFTALLAAGAGAGAAPGELALALVSAPASSTVSSVMASGSTGDAVLAALFPLATPEAGASPAVVLDSAVEKVQWLRAMTGTTPFDGTTT